MSSEQSIIEVIGYTAIGVMAAAVVVRSKKLSEIAAHYLPRSCDVSGCPKKGLPIAGTKRLVSTGPDGLPVVAYFCKHHDDQFNRHRMERALLRITG